MTLSGHNTLCCVAFAYIDHYSSSGINSSFFCLTLCILTITTLALDDWIANVARIPVLFQYFDLLVTRHSLLDYFRIQNFIEHAAKSLIAK